MTEDLLNTTAIAHALVILTTNPDHDVSDPQILVGFGAAMNMLGHQVEKAAQVEGDRQVELIDAMRANAADIHAATDHATRAAAMEALARSFHDFTDVLPGYHAQA